MGVEQNLVEFQGNTTKEKTKTKKRGLSLYGRESKMVDGVSVVSEGLPNGIVGVVGVREYAHGVTALTLTGEGDVYAEEHYPGADLGHAHLKVESSYGRAYRTDMDKLSGLSDIFKIAEEHYSIDRVTVDNVSLIRGQVSVKMPGGSLSLGEAEKFHTAVAELKNAAKKAKQK